MSRKLRLKAEGTRKHLSDLIDKLENHYVVVKTSQFIEHKEDEKFHIYLTLLEVDSQ